MITRTDGDNVTISQRARVCHKEQTADTMPDTNPIYPDTHNNLAAVLYLVPNGDAISKEANCFPKPESTSSSPESSSNAVVAESSSNATVTVKESSSNTVVIAIVVVVILLLVIVGIVAFIYWWKKVKGKVRVKNEALPRKRRFVFDIRTALTAGMGSSRKREKSFVQQNGSDLLIVHKSFEEKVMTGETEIYQAEMSPVSAGSGIHSDDNNRISNDTLPSTMIEKGLPIFQQGNEKD